MKKLWKGLLVGAAACALAFGMCACKPRDSGSDGTGGTPPNGSQGSGDEENTPELHFGADPFDGTWNEIVPNVGLMLYCDAIDKSGNRIEDLTTTGGKVVFTVVAGATAAGAAIRATSGRQYFVATGAGEATVKVTVADGDERKEATKKITVSEVGNGKKYATYSDFGQSLYNGNFPLNLDSDTTAGEPAENGRKGLVITRSGVFANRDRNVTSTGTLGLVYCGDLGDSYEITMDITPHHISPNDQWNSVVFKFWTGSSIGNDADAGNWYVNWNGGFKECKLGANKNGAAMGSATCLSDDDRTDKVEFGKPFTLKLSRSVADRQASTRLEYKTGQTAYKTLLSITRTVSEASGSAGAKIINLVVQHEFAQNGSFELNNIVKTKK